MRDHSYENVILQQIRFHGNQTLVSYKEDIYRTMARRYEFYVRVADLISHSILMTAFLMIFDHFPKISEDFPKLFRRPDECSRTFFENIQKFPKMVH